MIHRFPRCRGTVVAVRAGTGHRGVIKPGSEETGGGVAIVTVVGTREVRGMFPYRGGAVVAGETVARYRSVIHA